MTTITYPIDTIVTGPFEMQHHEVGERKMIVLTHEDLFFDNRKRYQTGELKIENVEHHHFQLTKQQFGEASYVIFVSADNRMKVIKHRTKIIIQ